MHLKLNPMNAVRVVDSCFACLQKLLHCKNGKNTTMTSSKSCGDYRMRCDKGNVSQEVLLKLEKAYDTLVCSSSKSLLKKHLNRHIFDILKEIKTPMGATLLDCIQYGVANLDANIGACAPEPAAYTAYKELFDPIIEEYHGFNETQKHPKPNWGNPCELNVIDPENKYVVSTRVRTGRNIEGYAFNPLLTEDEYLDLEKKISCTLNDLQGELKGAYYPLKSMASADQQKLINDHFLFMEGNRFMQAANSTRFWPKGRGIFYNCKKTFLCWVCEEDHVRIISMQSGSDLKEVYKRLMNAVEQLEKALKFCKSKRLGNLCYCPTNLGTAIRASVHIKLPKLGNDYSVLESIAAKYKLQIRGTAGEHTKSQEGVYDISNKRRLGITEWQAAKEMYDGISAIIKAEQELKA